MRRALLTLAFLLALVPRFAWADYTLTSLGTASGTGATLVITVPPDGIPDGALILLTVAETVTATIGSVADSVGSNYTNSHRSAAGGGGFIGALFSATGVAPINAGGTITYTLNNATDTAVLSAFYAVGNLTGSPVKDTATAAVAVGTSAAPSVTSGAPTKSNDLFVGMVAWLGAATFTQDSSIAWGTPPVAAASGSVVKVAGGSFADPTLSTLTYAPTLSASSVWVEIIAGFFPQAPHFLTTQGAGQ